MRIASILCLSLFALACTDIPGPGPSPQEPESESMQSALDRNGPFNRCSVQLVSTALTAYGVNLESLAVTPFSDPQQADVDLYLYYGRGFGLAGRFGDRSVCDVGVGFASASDIPDVPDCEFQGSMMLGANSTTHEPNSNRGRGLIVREHSGERLWKVLILEDEVVVEGEEGFVRAAFDVVSGGLAEPEVN